MDSESDSDYEPEVHQQESEAIIEKVDLSHAQELLQDIKKTETDSTKLKKDCSLDEAIRIARVIKESSNLKTEVKVNFAGETVDFSLGKRNRPSLDKILAETRKPKAMSTLSKSTLDWEKYKESNSLEDRLSKNRKDGYLAKKDFLLSAKEKEKDQLLSLKRKKPS